MHDIVNKIHKLLLDELAIYDEIISKNNSPYLFIDLIRAIDSYYVAEYENKDQYEPFIRLGFSRFLKQLYLTKQYDLGGFPQYTSTVNSLSFCHYYLYQYGKCKFVERALELLKLSDIKVSEGSNNNFTLYYYKDSSFVEYLENQSIRECFNFISNNILKDKIEKLGKDRGRIEKLLLEEVKVWNAHYIKYGSTPEIDDYYNQYGYIHLLTSQLYDDFDEKFTFGGIPYKEFLDVAQALIGVSFKHLDCCMTLLNKQPSINLGDIISLPMVQEDIVAEYSNYLDIEANHVREILDVFTVSEKNIDVHLKAEKDFSPLFIKFDNRFSIRFFKGGVMNPILFLQTELKERYPKDYFKWINERELSFRNQLYSLFPDDRIITVKRNIELNSHGIRTDIDAVVYDKKTNSLALFQLKWQDKYASDMKARQSRIKNFYPKAIEWIDKMDKWVETVSKKEISSALTLDPHEIGEVYLFVIGRYNTHFSNEEIDERAVWASWYHVVEVMHKIATNIDDPIRELYVKLKIDSPRSKNVDDLIPENHTIELDKFSVNIKYV